VRTARRKKEREKLKKEKAEVAVSKGKDSYDRTRLNEPGNTQEGRFQKGLNDPPEVSSLIRSCICINNRGRSTVGSRIRQSLSNKEGKVLRAHEGSGRGKKDDEAKERSTKAASRHLVHRMVGGCGRKE